MYITEIFIFTTQKFLTDIWRKSLVEIDKFESIYCSHIKQIQYFKAKLKNVHNSKHYTFKALKYYYIKGLSIHVSMNVASLVNFRDIFNFEGNFQGR